MIARVFRGIALLALTGCGSTELHEIILRQPTTAPHRDVELYVVGRPPSRAFYEVGLLQAIGHGTHADVPDVTNALQNRARTLGCDAVVGIHVELGITRAHATGVCVNWYKVVPPSPSTPAQGPSEPTPEAPAPSVAPTEQPPPSDATSI